MYAAAWPLLRVSLYFVCVCLCESQVRVWYVCVCLPVSSNPATSASSFRFAHNVATAIATKGISKCRWLSAGAPANVPVASLLLLMTMMWATLFSCCWSIIQIVQDSIGILLLFSIGNLHIYCVLKHSVYLLANFTVCNRTYSAISNVISFCRTYLNRTDKTAFLTFNLVQRATNRQSDRLLSLNSFLQRIQSFRRNTINWEINYDATRANESMHGKTRMEWK